MKAGEKISEFQRIILQFTFDNNSSQHSARPNALRKNFILYNRKTTTAFVGFTTTFTFSCAA